MVKEKLEAQLIRKKKLSEGENSRSRGNIRLVSACRHRERPAGVLQIKTPHENALEYSGDVGLAWADRQQDDEG